MILKRFPPIVSLIMALLAFGIATIPALGLVMQEDMIGRIIYVSAWSLVGLAWLGQLLRAD